MKKRIQTVWAILGFSVLLNTGLNAQWVRTQGLPGGRIRDFCAMGSNMFMAMDRRLFISLDEGLSWAPVSSPGKNTDIFAVATLDDFILVGTSNGLYKSQPAALNWEKFNQAEISNVPALSIFTYTGYLFVGSRGAVYKSMDKGQTWVRLNSGLPEDARISCFAGVVKIAVAGSENHGVFITESKNWIPGQFEMANNQIRQLEVFGTKLFAVIGNDVMVSFNLGADWETSSFTLRNINSLFADKQLLYAGTDEGVFRSQNKGVKWEPFNQGLPKNIPVQSIEGINGHIFVSTPKGVWRMSTSLNAKGPGAY